MEMKPKSSKVYGEVPLILFNFWWRNFGFKIAVCQKCCFQIYYHLCITTNSL